MTAIQETQNLNHSITRYYIVYMSNSYVLVITSNVTISVPIFGHRVGMLIFPAITVTRMEKIVYLKLYDDFYYGHYIEKLVICYVKVCSVLPQ